MKGLDRDELLAIALVFAVLAALVLWLWFGLSTATADCGRPPCSQMTCEFSPDCGPGCYCFKDNGPVESGVCLHRLD